MRETYEIYEADNIEDFDLNHIFDCGQCFRWKREADGSYTGTAFGRIANFSYFPAAAGRRGGRLVAVNCSEEEFEKVWSPYLDLGRDYGQIKKRLRAGDEIMTKAVEYGSGIRILRQELWETTLSFIISQNNNIPRIRGCIETLARRYGKPLGFFRERQYFAVPEAEVVAELEEKELRDCGLGYRAPYLLATARQFMDAGGPDRVAQRLAGSEDPAAELEQFRGVGPKVANCIALFAVQKYDAFPIDVWVRRVMSRLYHMDEKDVKAMKNYAAEHFAGYGGFAQQYLFYYIRGLSRSAFMQEPEEKDL